MIIIIYEENRIFLNHFRYLRMLGMSEKCVSTGGAKMSQSVIAIPLNI